MGPPLTSLGWETKSDLDVDGRGSRRCGISLQTAYHAIVVGSKQAEIDKAMNNPSWVDEEYSRILPELREQGEGQHLEFKERWPESARDLAKEIAAFATSQGGTILLGVSDDGTVFGLKGVDTASARDDMSRRLAGICTGSVKPSITPLVKWAIEGDKTVLVIVVPEGSQPIYYSSGIPYLRHLGTSRHAEPHEVVEIVLAHHGRSGKEETEVPPWAYRLITTLQPIILFASELDQRMVNPWLGQTMAQAGQAAATLRELLAEGAIPLPHDQSAKSLVGVLDRISTTRLTMGAGSALRDLFRSAAELADGLWERVVEPFQGDPRNHAAAKQSLLKSMNLLRDLLERSVDMLRKGQTDEFKSGVAEVGFSVFQAAMLNLRVIAPEIATDLIHIGARLHAVETATLYMDGGASQTKLIEQVRELEIELTEAIKILG